MTCKSLVICRYRPLQFSTDLPITPPLLRAIPTVFSVIQREKKIINRRKKSGPLVAFLSAR